MEYYLMNGEWQSSLLDIRLKPEEMTDGQYLDKVCCVRTARYRPI